MRESYNSLLIANDKLVEINSKFAAVNKELAAVHEQIKKHQEKQNEFINIISHELKTPIQAIVGYVELLLDEPEKNLIMVILYWETQKDLKMVSDILDMSKIDNNALTLYKEQFNIDKIILSTVDDIRERGTQYNKKINIVYNNTEIKDKDTIIWGDKERIIQIISNILNNAIEFTKEGTINIDIKKSESIDNYKDNRDSKNKSKEIIINIKDTCKGIDSKTSQHLFSKFFSTSGIGGTGLGLYISKSIIEAHGGKIRAQNNEDGNGATFSFSLPLDKEE